MGLEAVADVVFMVGYHGSIFRGAGGEGQEGNEDEWRKVEGIGDVWG